MRIGVLISPDWLDSENDHDLRFIKQIGVDYVDIPLDMVEGYAETGHLEKENLSKLVDRLDAVGLRIERANPSASHYMDARLGRPRGQRQIENLCGTVEMLGEAEVPIMGARIGFSGRSLVSQHRPGWSEEQGRGGYGHPAFDLNTFESLDYKPELRVTADELWENLLNIYRQVIPVAEQAGVKVAMHGNDPPVYQACGNPQILCRFADFDRLFAEVPSPNNGMTFCVGTRYESGEDVFEGIRHFGQQGKIFHVHFRNVRGTLPSTRGYAEVFVDEGDLKMREVAQALHEVGYEGEINPDHVYRISGDTHHGRQYIAFAVGYMKGLLEGLPPQ